MARFDHLSISVADLDRGIAQFDPVMQAMGAIREDGEGSVAWDLGDGETEFILFPAREPGSGPHVHGRVGWQHLAFSLDTREDVDRLHEVALAAGWTAVRHPKPYPRFSDRYYASFVESADGIRIEFMLNPPREAAAG